MAISCALKFFLAVIGNHAPALTVASLATITQDLPAIFPITTTTPAEGQPPYSLYMFSAARTPISKTSSGWSTKWLIRFLALSFPFSSSFFKRSFPPPSLFFRTLASSAAQAILIASLFFSSSSFIRMRSEIRKY